jgi:hypothetical protein
MRSFFRMFLAALAASLCFQAPASALAAENPPAAKACGLDIALVIDSSDSVSETELATMKSALADFIDSLSPATPSEFAVVDFDETVRTTPFTASTTVAKAAVDAAEKGGGTNWQAALEAARGLFDPRSDHENLVVFASDGNPNYIGTPPHATTSAAALSAAVSAADAIKSSGTRILAIGIGNATGADALNVGNLVAVTGPRVNMGDESSDVITTDWAGVANAFAALAVDLCGTPPHASGGNGAPLGSLGSSGQASGSAESPSEPAPPAYVPPPAPAIFSPTPLPAEASGVTGEVKGTSTEAAVIPSADSVQTGTSAGPDSSFPWWIILLLALIAVLAYIFWRYRSASF